MRGPVSRRTFLEVAAGAAAAPLAAQTAPMNPLGVDLFTLRDQGWTAFELLDFCAENGAQVVNFSEPRFLGSLEPDHLARVKAHAEEKGLAIEVGFGSICPTSTRFDADAGSAPEQLRRMLRVAEAVGSPIVRCYLGSSNDRSTPGVSLDEHIENTVRTCKAVRPDFLRAGVKIAVENHAGDLQALQLKALVEEAGTEYVGALLDAGNAAWTLEDPQHTLETLAPIAVTTGVRDSRIWRTEEGVAVMWVPLGKGNIGIRRWAERLAELRPDLPFSLEMINVPGPRIFAVEKPEFWEAYRDVPAWVYQGFLDAAEGGEPYQAPQPPVSREDDPEAYAQWARELQRADAVRDLAFCRNELGLGRS